LIIPPLSLVSSMPGASRSIVKFHLAYRDMKLVILSTNKTMLSTIVHHGCIPSRPLTLSVCITIQCLEPHQIAHLCSPDLSIQAFVTFILFVLYVHGML
jgi:hypothetical protein